jgi:hypothetical protein
MMIIIARSEDYYAIELEACRERLSFVVPLAKGGRYPLAWKKSK